MRSIHKPALAFIGFFLITASASAQQSTTVKVPTHDPAMTAAFAKAHGTLDDFLAKLAHPAAGTEHYAVKIGIKDTPGGGFAVMRPGGENRTEYFWVGDIKPEGTGFTGALHNQPEYIRNVTFNQTIQFGRDDIADWTYFDHGKMKGNFTACPALVHSPAGMAQMHEKFGLTCD